VEAEHQVQLELVRALKGALEAGEDDPASGAVPALLRRLVDYSDAHFLSEQLLMRLYAYPAYADHVLEHDRLIGELRALAERWEKGEGGEAGALLRQVERWLLSHMATADKALEAYLAEHAPGPS
jgi:hemerythrin